MKILVLGASRGIGRQVIEQGVKRRHQMTALSRSPAAEFDSKVRVVTGDVCDVASLGAAIAGQDAVCFTVGITPTFKPVNVFSEATRRLVEVMKRAGVRRLVCITGIGAGDSRGQGGFIYDRILLPTLMRTTYADKDRQEGLIRDSDMNWTIVRPGFLTNGEYRGDYRVLGNRTGVKAKRISRADVAHFLLNEIESPGYVRRTVLLTR